MGSLLYRQILNSRAALYLTSYLALHVLTRGSKLFLLQSTILLNLPIGSFVHRAYL